MSNLLSISDLTRDEIEDIFRRTDELKSGSRKFSRALQGKSLGLIFQKPSNRTRVSFEVGIAQLGGYAVYLGPDEIQLGVREEIRDVARTLSRYLDCIVARTFSHNDVIELARHSSIPVINGLSDLTHPCQGLSDLYTIKEKLGRLKGLKLAYVGDGNNVLHSLLLGCSIMGMDINIATPKGYEPRKDILHQALEKSKKSGARITLLHKPEAAVQDSHVLYTDVWTSMGQEKERNKRLKAFKGFQVNLRLVLKARKDCLVLHCLPAHRGEEITDEVIEGRHSIVWDQAENRLHVQKAILLKLMG